MLRGFITNLGMYNEGRLEGMWVNFPMTADQEKKALKAIGIGRLYEEYFFTDWESDYSFSLCDRLGEFVSVGYVNKMAEALEGADANLIAAYLEAFGGTLEDALENVEDCIFYPDMTLEDVAYEVVEECYNLPEIAKRYFDYEAFARDLGFDGYTEVENGVILMG